MGNEYIDIFATKGIEYLLVILFLITLVVFWRLLNRPGKSVAATPRTSGITPPVNEWFRLVDGLFYHQGHSWLKPDEQQVVRIGIDDFAQKMLGQAARIILPKVGSQLEQGEKGWQMLIDGKTIDILSPVNGEVIEHNEELIQKPYLVNEEPYSKGWVMKVRAPHMRTSLRNLLSGTLARQWLTQDIGEIRARMAGDLSVVLQDGGMIVRGFARELNPTQWEEIAKIFLRTSDNIELSIK